MGTNMYFTKRDEILFIEYNEVIKSPSLFMLKLIRDQLKDIYKDFIWVDFLENKSDEELEIYLLQRKNKNIFLDLAKRSFNYEKTYDDLYNKYDDMFLKMPLMKIGNTIDFLVAQKFNKKIYFYSEKYDPRIELDIKYSFKDLSKIEYVYGDLGEVLEEIEQPTTYMLHDIWTLPRLVMLQKTELTDIVCARYPYNLKYNEELDEVEPIVLIEKYMEESVFKFGLFAPINFNDTHAQLLEDRIIKYSEHNN